MGGFSVQLLGATYLLFIYNLVSDARVCVTSPHDTGTAAARVRDRVGIGAQKENLLELL